MNLEQSLKIVLANTFALMLKSLNFHWNVEGANFAQHHAFLKDLYQELWESVDGIAENIRTLDMYAPGSFKRFAELSQVKDQTMVPRAELMFEELLLDNRTVLDSLQTAFDLSHDHLGVQNFIQDRITAHEKHGWMLRAIGRNSRG
jgi:starvation-inducible DNA-binding protein